MLTNNNGNERNNRHINPKGNGHHTSAPSRAAGVGISDAPFDDDDPPFIRAGAPLDKKAQDETGRDETAPPDDVLTDDVLTMDVVELTDADAPAMPDSKLKIRYFRTTPQQADGAFARKFLPKAAKPRIF